MPTRTASLPSGRILFGEDATFVLHCCEQLKDLRKELEDTKKDLEMVCLELERVKGKLAAIAAPDTEAKDRALRAALDALKCVEHSAAYQYVNTSDQVDRIKTAISRIEALGIK